MRRAIFFLPLILSLLAGCKTAPSQPHFIPPVASFPANAFITERALFMARGAQFPLNGYLALSETGGKRLIVTGNFGRVVADVLVKPDGRVFVMQSSRMFPPKYIRIGIASDLQSIFGGAPIWPAKKVQTPEPNHFIINRGHYVLDLRLLEIKPGAQRAELFDETKAEKK